MIVEGSSPNLRRRLDEPDHVLADAGLADVNAELPQLTVDARSTLSAGCRGTECADQLKNVFGNARPTGLSVSDLPPPERAKAPPISGDDGCNLDDSKSRRPVAPHSVQRRP